jgi:hypothetical protein
MLIGLAGFYFGSVAIASDLDQHCNPQGWIQKFSAWWDPVRFWSSQPSAIQQEVETRFRAYQVYLVQRERDEALAVHERRKKLVEQGALEEQRKILGIKPKEVSPEALERLEQVLANADKTLEETRVRLDEAQQQGVANTIRWGEQCVAFSREQLAKIKQ